MTLAGAPARAATTQGSDLVAGLSRRVEEDIAAACG